MIFLIAEFFPVRKILLFRTLIKSLNNQSLTCALLAK